jgi:error-prone DNA polymerase
MAWDLSRTETLPFPEAAPGAPAYPGPELPGPVPGPLDGISRNLAITGLGG